MSDKTCPLMKCKCVGTLCAWYTLGENECAIAVIRNCVWSIYDDFDRTLRQEGKKP